MLKNKILSCLGGGGVVEKDPNFSNTVLLLHGDGTNGAQNNTFIDSSPNNVTITRNGNVTQGSFSPFPLNGKSYSPAVHGGSGYFDGVGDVLTHPGSVATSFGTGDFTIEAWIHPTANGSLGSFIWCVNLFNGSQPYFCLYSGKLAFGRTGGYPFVSGGSTIPMSTWTHVAAVRASGTLRLYVNGVLDGSASDGDSYNDTVTVRSIGSNLPMDANWNFTGYISNLRIIKGTALYTGNFTPPTAPLTAITNTSLLLNFTNAGIYDNTGMNNLETVGNAQVSTTQKKFGTGAMYFDGSEDILQIPYSPQFDLGAGDFTIEGWVYSQSEGGKYFINVNGSGSYGQVAMAVYGAAKIEVDISTSNNGWAIIYSSPNNSFPLNQWNHVALVRSGSSFTLYINGTGYSVGTNASALYNYSGITCVGSGSPSSYNFQGYIDDLRITKGYARYTANFTPPSRAFPDQ